MIKRILADTALDVVICLPFTYMIYYVVFPEIQKNFTFIKMFIDIVFIKLFIDICFSLNYYTWRNNEIKRKCK